MKRKFISTFISIAVLLGCTNITLADTHKKIELGIGSSIALIDGVATSISKEDSSIVPYLSNEDRTMVPIRFISEGFGAIVEWNGENNTVTISQNPNILILTIDKTDYTLNGHTVQSDTAPVIVSDVTRVPLRLVAEGLGLRVYWNDGLITICDIEQNISTQDAITQLGIIKNHIHSFYDVATTIHHEGSGHYEDVVVGFETHTTQVVICNCGAQFSTQSEFVAHKQSYPVPYVGHNGFETIESVSSTPIYEKQWVEDSAAWDETITVRVCNCGLKE